MSDDELKAMGFESHRRRSCELWLTVGVRSVCVDRGEVWVVNAADEWTVMSGVKTVADLRELIRLMGNDDE